MKQTTVMSVALVLSSSFAAAGFIQEPQANKKRPLSGLLCEIDAGLVPSDVSLPAPPFVLEWGRRGKGEGEFSACVGITIGKNDEVYTAEFRNQRVQRFTSQGRFLGTFAVQPHAGGIAVDPEGNVYAHWNSNKVAAYSPQGKLVREWGRKGSGDGEFQLP